MSFHEVRFPADLSFGSVGGPERRTEVVTLANGFEERNSPWAYSRRRYDAGLGMRSLDDVDAMVAFFEARQGQLFGFRWKDWADFKSSVPSAEVDFRDQVIGQGDEIKDAFQLVKTYASGEQSYVRPIHKPVLGTVRIGVEGIAQQESVHFEMDYATGVVTFDHPPDVGATITAGYEFDVPVRFDTDLIQTAVATFQSGQVPSVPVVEVRL